MHSSLTDTVCFGDYADLDPTRLRSPNVVVITTNCEDMGPGGSRLGCDGPTGRDLVRCPRWAALLNPDIIVVETSGHAATINGGADIARIKAALSDTGYIPHAGVRPCVDFWIPPLAIA